MFLDHLKNKYPILREFEQRRRERALFLKDAIVQFNKEMPEHGNISDYKRALWKHRVSYREYMYGYEFWRLNEKERSEFISEGNVVYLQEDYS